MLPYDYQKQERMFFYVFPFKPILFIFFYEGKHMNYYFYLSLNR